MVRKIKVNFSKDKFMEWYKDIRTWKGKHEAEKQPPFKQRVIDINPTKIDTRQKYRKC